MGLHQVRLGETQVISKPCPRCKGSMHLHKALWICSECGQVEEHDA